jgi:hypothetical protein
MKKIGVLLIFAGLLVRCESSGTGEMVDIPNVQIDCDTALCLSRPGIHSVVVNITRSGCAADQIEMSPVVVGDASATCGGSGCTATVTSWRDVNASTVTQIESRVYSVCTHLNLDDITGKSINDEFAEENLLVTSITINLTDWGAENYRYQKPTQNH